MERPAAPAPRCSPTPTDDDLPRRRADFATMTEALDYVAQGVQGHELPRSPRASWCASIRSPSCARTRSPHARRLIARGVAPGDRIALIAETGARFRRPVLRRALCRRLAGAAAAADLVRRRAKPISTSSRCSWRAPIPSSCFYPAELQHGRRRGRAAGRRGARLGRASPPRPRRMPTLPAADRGRHRLSAIFERLDPLPARRRHHPPGADGQPRRPCRFHAYRPGRPRRLLAAFLSRHGPGRLHALDGRQPDVGRLSEDRGFRPPPARLARSHHPQQRQCR